MGTYTKEQLTTQLERIQSSAASTRTAIINRGINFCPADAKLADLAYYAKFLCDFPDIRLDYIQADETPSSASVTSVYFNTDYYPDSSTDIEISYQNTIQSSSSSSSYTLIGCSHTTGGGFSFSGDHYIMAPAQGRALRYRNNSNFTASSSINIDTNKHKIRSVTNGVSQSVYFDGSLAASGTSSSLVKFELPLYIFSERYNSISANYALKGTRIYYIKIWREGNLERFYIPVLHYYNGQYTPCFYDKVNDNYIYNLGSGTIIYSRSEDIMLDYIYRKQNSTGFHYDTALAISSNISIDTKFFTGDTVASGNTNEGMIIGYRYSGTYKYGVYAPTQGTSGNVNPVVYVGYLAPASNGTRRLNATTFNAGTSTIVLSATVNRSNNYRKTFVDNVVYTTTTVDENSSSYGNYIGIFGNSTQEAYYGTKIYYACLADSSYNAYSYIPVLHNNSPCFYDTTNNNYIYCQSGRDPGYEILN